MGDLDSGGLPVREGIFLVKEDGYGNKNIGIDVYSHPIKGLSCFYEDFGSSGTGIGAECDCHVSVQFTGLEFIERLGDIGSR